MRESSHTYERVRQYIWEMYASHMNVSFHTYEWVMSLTYEGITSQAWWPNASHVKESCYTYERVESLCETCIGRVAQAHGP